MQLRSQTLQGACFKGKHRLDSVLQNTFLFIAFLQPVVWDWSDISSKELRDMSGVVLHFLLWLFFPPVRYRKEILEHLIHAEGKHTAAHLHS